MAKYILRPTYLLLLLGLMMSSCATEFEKVRTSNDPALILKKGHEYYDKEEYVNAQTLYELAIQYYRGRQEAEELFYKYAYTYYHMGEYISSSHYFTSFASTFYNSPNREEAAFMGAYSHYKLSPNTKLDQSSSIKAIEAFQEFTNNYPESPRVNQCNDLIDELRNKLEEKSFNVGKLYYDIGQYQAAVVAFTNTLVDYPGSKREEEAKYLLVKSAFVLAQNSVIDKRAERYETALKLAEKYKSKIQNRSYKKEIESIIANINNNTISKA